MTYLLELRTRLIYCLVATFLVFLLLSAFSNQLYQYLAKPLLLKVPTHTLIATKITAGFLVPLKLSFIVSLLVLAPYFFYHLWHFVSPALYLSEKRKIWRLLLPTVVLFYLGIAFAYFLVLPTIFFFLVKSTPMHVELLPDISHYLEFCLQMLFAFGLAFEVPVIVMVLVNFDLVTIQELRNARRYVIVLAFIIGMLLTPPDIFSQTLLALPLWGLYELGIFLAEYFKR